VRCGRRRPLGLDPNLLDLDLDRLGIAPAVDLAWRGTECRRRPEVASATSGSGRSPEREQGRPAQPVDLDAAGQL
jgi:hypothetical protein